MLQAIFLDRDGVINHERADYVKSWQEFEFLPGSLTALSRLARLPQPIIVISNQSAIGRGLVTRETVDAIHYQLRATVEADGGRIDAFYVCPHHPDDGCACRKPKPGLLLQAAHDFELDLKQSVFVGDSRSDYQAAMAVGCRCILVTSGRQGAQLRRWHAPDKHLQIVADLSAAVSMLLILDIHVAK
jgi:D-glycero-D-manno-heptose 1,7-bisphosphate phosphatase